MKNFSKFALTSIAALTVASPLVNTDANAKKESATQKINAEVTQQTDAPKALKALPDSQNVKNHYKDYAVTDTQKTTKVLPIIPYNLKLVILMPLIKR